MFADLGVRGFTQTIRRRQAASATRVVPGEPLTNTGTLTSGVMSSTTFVLLAADGPVVGTDRFGGISLDASYPRPTGTVVAGWLNCACPIPWLGRIQGRAETVASVDTLTELVGVLGDAVLFDYNSTGASDGGELYTIKEVASADTSGLEIVDGIPARGILEVVVDGRAYRNDVAA